ncbi:MAG: S8 family serine peptidase, partial [Aliifodinibius sp.]|nr:S8 family serine peptidase [Fodinibius sp.]NIV15444.1 S8 family serine peptidase [Fodinibius sp.]NIY29293.1 S8 family serine peptidase [Fodinibius sp.]
EDDDQNGFVDDFIGWDFVNNDNDPFRPGQDHGTAVASVAGARTHNTIGMAGSAFYCKIMGLSRTRSVETSKSIYYAILNEADIINLSLGSNSSAVHAAIKLAYERGIILVGAAGNSRQYQIFYPASHPEVISVSGMDPDYIRNGNYHETVELIAPYPNIVTMSFDNQTTQEHTYQITGATSIATPLTSGAIAGVWSQFPNESNIEIRRRMAASATNVEPYNLPMFTGMSGTGLVNMLNAYLTSSFTSLKANLIEILNDTNGDSRISPGETFELRVVLKNNGEDVENVSAWLSNSDPGEQHISIHIGQVGYGNINYLEQKPPDNNFLLSAGGNPEPGYVARLNLHLQFSSSSNPNGSQDLTIPLIIEDANHNGFPSATNNANYPVLWDFNKDGIKDFVILYDSKLALYSSAYPTPFLHDVLYKPARAVAIGNVDDDQEDEIIYNSLLDKMFVMTFRNEQLIEEYPEYSTGLNILRSSIPVFADLDSDKRFEILIPGENNLKVLDFDVNSAQFNNLWTKPFSNMKTPVVADLDQDGKLEVVVAHGCSLSVLDKTGDIQDTYVPTEICNGISTPTIADLDQDGILEIIFNQNVVFDLSSGGADHQLIALQYQSGSISNPIFTGPAGLFRGRPPNFHRPLVVYDLDNDGYLEIIYTQSRDVMIYEYDLSSFFLLPNMYEANIGSPTIAEIEGYNFPLMFFNMEGNFKSYIYGYAGDGTLPFDNGQSNILYSFSSQPRYSPATLDYDGDDNYDIAIGAKEKIYAWKGRRKLNKPPVTWHQRNKNANNSKLFGQVFTKVF